ncbi:MAG: pro-sigmaK processing inhibitor BofA family protein [Oscillospiraceae bacterium]|jgi:inhibitor of the pro-sigma K processing machinery|nr:pro-sigmaK processing inhibitor BofA family protein [Oscillospiraceae bacterium]
MPVNFITAGAVIVCILLVALLFKIIKTPLRWALKLLLNAISGFIALVILNFFGAIFGLSLSINLVSCLVAGVLGLPGVVLLLLIKYLF